MNACITRPKPTRSAPAYHPGSFCVAARLNTHWRVVKERIHCQFITWDRSDNDPNFMRHKNRSLRVGGQL